jgi:predicted chitinase/LysM repeat protein
MTTYSIRSGDTLSGIAGRFNTSAQALAAANNIANPNLIYAGQQLTIPDVFEAKAPAPAVDIAPTQGPQYTVQPGDSLSGIASRFNTSVASLASLNQIQNPNLIYPGQQLQVPQTQPAAPAPNTSPSQYTVQSGDSLSSIAARFQTSVSQLVLANGISNANLIYVGQQLNVPRGAPPTPPVTPGTPIGPTTGGVSSEQLRRIMPNLSAQDAARYIPLLNAAMAEADINTPLRQSAFLAQLAQESGQLRYFEEIASGAAYEGRADLGNTQAGDGVRFKGRGPIQLTGRSNYEAAGRDLGLDLVNNPAQAADPEVGFRIATWFWGSRNLNALADVQNFDGITRRVNGGYNGKADRDMYYARAKQVLGA